MKRGKADLLGEVWIDAMSLQQDMEALPGNKEALSDCDCAGGSLS